MTSPRQAPTAAGPTDPLRRHVPWILALALLGTLAELVLLEHYDGWKQWLPLGGLALACLAGVVLMMSRSAGSRRAFEAVMVGLVLLGCAGVVLHWQGNLEFEREISPELSGRALWLEVARGATPVLAPGSLVPFGLLGLLLARTLPLRHSEDS